MNFMNLFKSILSFVEIYDEKTKNMYFFANGKSISFVQ